jgi:hypothetical protein
MNLHAITNYIVKNRPAEIRLPVGEWVQVESMVRVPPHCYSSMHDFFYFLGVKFQLDLDAESIEPKL